MVRIRYNAALKPFAQSLRRNMTEQEKHLWYDYLKIYPVQFRRQKQFGRFIVDFYCANAKLVIEIDGGHHFTKQGNAYDSERSLYLEGLGLKVIRFSNKEIDYRFDEVCQRIDAVVKANLIHLPR